MMITPDMDIFFCRKGYIRLATETYSLNDKEKFRHLTNNCLQKYSKIYKKEDDIIDSKTLEKYVKDTIREDFDFEKEIIPEILMMIRILGIILIKNKNEIYEKKSILHSTNLNKNNKGIKWVCECGKTFIKEDGKFK